MSGDTLTSSLRYLRKNSRVAEIRAAKNDGTGRDNDDFCDTPVSIQNARKLRNLQLLDNGFELISTPYFRLSASDSDSIEKYTRFLTDTISEKLNAKHVIAFQHNWRSTDVEASNPGLVRAPVRVVHNDYSPIEARRVYKLCQELAGNQTALPHCEEFLILTAWRTTHKDVHSFPLAICDARTIEKGDVVDVERKSEGRSHILQLATHSEQHEWYYYPKMKSEEVLIFVCFNSNSISRAKMTLHSAFDAPSAKRTARESVETRILVCL